ncbi:hypothetical protein DOM22_09390 [Bdellovibrio sp. ZAP7]|uniref:hypothetical protein n=1 Tax=Bdellovibrio sp. ZAP7 TaxID=2231053 RepID=UPI0011577EB3|nr:hypothetical protein [Bdellovibrio sp. ZAP7]QDK45350.1 hypothetical protein DOM22_09390 [Bdellovibrio sp. ZAP7]
MRKRLVAYFEEILSTRIVEQLLTAVFYGILLWASYHYLFEVRPWLENLSFDYPATLTMLPADPHVYWKFSGFMDWKDLQINLYGPYFVLKLFGCNPDLVFTFNLLLLLGALYYFAQAVQKSFFAVSCLVLLNPIILSQVFYPNKEIYMLVSSFLLLTSEKLENKNLLCCGLFVAFFAKIEFILVVLFWVFARRYSTRIYYVIVSLILVVISIGYSMIPGMSGKLTVLGAAEQFKNFGFTAVLQYLAEKYHLFFLVVIPRVAISMLEGVINFIRVPSSFSEGFHTIISSFVMSTLFLLVLFRTRFNRLSSEYLFLALWLIAVGTVPFALHRYMIPIYPFLFSILLSPKLTNETVNE